MPDNSDALPPKQASVKQKAKTGLAFDMFDKLGKNTSRKKSKEKV